MKSVCRVTLLGNVCRDPEAKATTSGIAVCSFGVATERRWKDSAGDGKKLTEFHSVVCWGPLADIAGKFVKKGEPVYVEGYLKTRNWEKDGVKHYKTEVIAEQMTFLGQRDEEKQEAEPANGFPEHTPSVRVEELPF